MLSEIRAERGEIRLVNQVAAVLSECRVATGETAGTRVFTARCETVNTYLMTLEPDVLALQIGGRLVCWRIQALDYGGTQVSGRLIGMRPEVR